MSALTKSAALALAGDEMARHFEGEVEVVIVDDLAEETDVGWVFPYESRAYLESNDFADKLIGEGPLLVTEDGRALFMGTAHPPGWYVDALRRGEEWE